MVLLRVEFGHGQIINDVVTVGAEQRALWVSPRPRLHQTSCYFVNWDFHHHLRHGDTISWHKPCPYTPQTKNTGTFIPVFSRYSETFALSKFAIFSARSFASARSSCSEQTQTSRFSVWSMTTNVLPSNLLTIYLCMIYLSLSLIRY
jgi:hypothetical protein